jgi:hypothetical protein
MHKKEDIFLVQLSIAASKTQLQRTRRKRARERERDTKEKNKPAKEKLLKFSLLCWLPSPLHKFYVANRANSL